MIKIYKYGEVADSEVFARVTPKVDVAAIVSDIIAQAVLSASINVSAMAVAIYAPFFKLFAFLFILSYSFFLF